MPEPSEQRPFPYAAFEGPDFDLDGFRFSSTDFAGAHAEGRTFLECTLVDCDLTDAALHSTRWSDCVWDRVQGVGVALPDATLQEVTIEQSRLAAVSAWGSHWRGVTVRGGKVDFLNLRGATLRDVTFEDCVVIELDLQEATVEGLRFPGCTLIEPEFGRGRYRQLDLRGAQLRGPRGAAGLRGALVTSLQLLDLAAPLALEAGIEVTD